MLEPLRHFVLVVQHGTFTAAARHAHVTQPALTASIQRLEQQMGARLFERGRGGASLTAAGDALLPRARAAMAAIEDGRRAVLEVAGLHAGAVRLGAGATVCTYYLPRTLVRFRSRHPAVRFHLREGPPDELVDDLEAGDLDLVILARTSKGGGADLLRAARSGLARERWLDDEVVLVGAPGIDAKTAPLVTFARGHATRALVDRLFPERTIAMELGSIAAVKGNTRAGVGIALVSRRAVERDVAAGQLEIVPSEHTPLVRPLYILHRGRDRLPPAAAELLRMLRARE
ncbi:MAG: LysR family transcriptional regulator [Deltaproteobacteria bacterium]|nr:LysR family transcriptional regulator [Deltaproteobacteria bacterium]